MKKFIILALFLSISSMGCSVVMALHGKETKDVGSIRIGHPRSGVLAKLGQPVATFKTETGRTDVFELEKGNDKSIGRAVYYGFADIVTFGTHEIFGTTAEALKGRSFKLTIEYNKKDNVTYFQTEEK